VPAATILLHFLQYFYAPAHGAWYTGNVWGNVFVVAVVAPLGWLWSRTKFWPLRPIRRGLDRLHARHDEHAGALSRIEGELASLHRKHDALAGRLALGEEARRRDPGPYTGGGHVR